MSVDKIIVLVLSAFGIGFTYWFFLMKKDQEVRVSDSVDIVVEGGYTPSTISIQNNKTTKINFLRKDANSCLEEVVLSGFNIKKFLPLDQKVTVAVHPKKTGEYGFSCGMNMFHGKIVVR